MQLLELPSTTADRELAIDEAIWLSAEKGDSPRESLRLWEPSPAAVILGRSSRVTTEVDETACQQRGLNLFRRITGGCAVLAGPGCLLYSLVLSFDVHPLLRSVDQAHDQLLGALVVALRARVPSVVRRGTSDLAMGDWKFSGNSLRVGRTHLLYHGTLLYDFPLDLIAHALRRPPREPDYRAQRSHQQFVANLPLSRGELRAAVLQAWPTTGPADPPPAATVEKLLAERYRYRQWNYQH